MQCTICKQQLTEADNPVVFDVHDVLPDGELGTGFTVALCPPSLENRKCEQMFRDLAQKRGLTLVPVDRG